MDKKKLFCTFAVTVGIAGATGTGIFCGYKYAKEIERMKSDLNRSLNSKEKILVGLKYFTFPSAIAAASIITVVAVYKNDLKTQAALVGSYTILSDRFNAFKNQVEKELGKEKVQQLQDEAAIESFEYNGPMPDPSKNEKLYVDEFTNEVFIASEYTVLEAFFKLNMMMSENGYAYYKDLRKFLGLPELESSPKYYWDSWELYEMWGSNFIDYWIEPYVVDGKEVRLIRYLEPVIEPTGETNHKLCD